MHGMLFCWILIGSWLLTACSNSSNKPGEDTETSTDSDTDTDSDADTDADLDADTDSDSDTSTTSDSDTGSDSDTDTGVESGWVTIPAGSFWMGSPDGDCPTGYPAEFCVNEFARQENEELHYVTLTRSFSIMTTEVTQGQFTEIMSWNPSLTQASDNEICNGGKCAVEYVSWYDAVVYANALSVHDGLAPCYEISNITCEDDTLAGTDPTLCMNDTQKGIDDATVDADVPAGPFASVYDCTGYRLPTEAEWEYTARAGSSTPFYPAEPDFSGTLDGYDTDNWPCFFEPLEPIAWHCGQGAIHEVGTALPNEWGVYDMLGGVREWTWDRYVETLVGVVSAPATDPSGGNASPYYSRVEKNCAVSDSATQCRTARRNDVNASSQRGETGFRLVRTLP